MLTRQAIVDEARRWIGTPYAHQASVRGVGCDCLGLVRGVWRHVFGSEPEPLQPYAPEWPFATDDDRLQAAAARHLQACAIDAAQAGDVVLFRWRQHLPASHAAILTDVDTLIHAHEGACVSEIPLAGWWRRHAAAAFRFPGLTASEGEST